MKFKAGTIEKIKEPGDWIIIDIGFSSKQQSTGILIFSTQEAENDYEIKVLETLYFLDSIKKTADFLKDTTRPKIILEAPLSFLFGKHGPEGRDPFEKKDKTDRAPNIRYWYTGPGAATSLAAIFFLRKLLGETKEVNREVLLYEGMVSFKNESKSNHILDVCRLYEVIKAYNETGKREDNFYTIYELSPTPDCITIFQLLGLSTREPPPPVIKWERDVKEGVVEGCWHAVQSLVPSKLSLSQHQDHLSSF